MAFVPTKKVYDITGSRYAAVIIASKEARRINSLPMEFREDKESKVTTIALERIAKGLVDFTKKHIKKEDEL